MEIGTVPISTEEVCIHIIGEVNNPGIVFLKKGQRIKDAIDLAGGVTKEADLNKVNLAYILSDGQKVRIPSIHDENNENVNITVESGKDVIIEENTNNSSNTKVNINTANQTELETLTGIGPSIASKIIKYREENGKFKKIEDLKNVAGIGEKNFNMLKEEITIK